MRRALFCHPLRPGREGKMIARQFDSSRRSCWKALSQLQAERLKTLNLLSSAAARPSSQELRTALKLQLDREELAESNYLQRRQALFNWLDESEQPNMTMRSTGRSNSKSQASELWRAANRVLGLLTLVLFALNISDQVVAAV